MHFILVSDHALLHSYPTTDNNTSTGRIQVTLNVGRSAVDRQGHVMEFDIVWILTGHCENMIRVITLWQKYASQRNVFVYIAADF